MTLPALADIRIGVIGLGYVGLPLAVYLSRHFPVMGFDIDAVFFALGGIIVNPPLNEYITPGPGNIISQVGITIFDIELNHKTGVV